MDSMKTWARKRHEKLSKAAYEAQKRALQALGEWVRLEKGEKPPASVTLRYEVWKRSQLRKQNGHNDKPQKESGERDL